MPKNPEQIIREEILALSAYHVPQATGMVKLDAMENPCGLPQELRDELARIAAGAALNRYPDPQATRLKARLCEFMNIPDGVDIMLGNGSDELIQIIALAVARPGASLMSVEPTFVMFRMISAFAGVKYVGVPLREDFSLDLDKMLGLIAQLQPAAIFIAYPNNPTGNLFDAKAISRIIETAPGAVIVDEAYHAFASASFMGELTRHPNLFLMRTVSKLGLAGLRLGVLMGRPEWIRQLEKLRLPYNVNVLTQLIAEKVLGKSEILTQQALEIRRERTVLLERLTGLNGVRVYPSDANFILFRVPGADQVFQGLLERRVLIKNLNGTHPLLANCLRVTVGTQTENRQFIQALKESLGA